MTRVFPGPKKPHPGEDEVCYGSVTFASGAVTASDIDGVSTVAKTATGKYKFTFAEKAATLRYAQGSVQERVVEVENDTLDNADPHVDLICKDLETPAATDAPDGTWYFLFIVRRTPTIS